MKIKFCLLTLSLFGTALSHAQVGIGNATPNSNTILDLTNTNNRSLLLPVPSVSPSTLTGTSFNIEGMMFYHSDNIYLKTSSSYKVITPWIYDGTAANGISSPANTPVGIGLTTTASAPMVLQVANAAADVSEISSNASVAVGLTTGAHMMIDNNEIMAKSNATTATALKLQEEGGTVEIRSSGADAGVGTVVTAYGSVDAKGKIKENGNDLLPVGSIIMWSGTIVPAGWALCDGGTYTLDAGGTVAVPNLLDRFIVAADVSGGGNQGGAGSSNGTYALNATGGQATVTLSVANLPPHNHDISHSHSITDPGHTHGIPLGDSGNPCERADDTGGNECTPQSESATTGITINTYSGSSGNGAGSSTAFNNRPPYYALAFIYKL